MFPICALRRARPPTAPSETDPIAPSVQVGLARSGHTLKAIAGQPHRFRPRHCARRRIRAPHEQMRAQQALGVRNQGVQSCGEAPCRGRWRVAGTP